MTKGIYSIDDIENWKVEKKLEYMMAEKTSVYQLRMVVLDIPKPNFRLKDSTKRTLSQKCEHIKKLIRDAYSKRIDNYFYDIIIHIGDNFRQNKYIYRLLMMPTIDVAQILNHISSFNYVLIKEDAFYMPEDFPNHYPLGKDIDIICADEKNYTNVLESIKKDIYQYRNSYNIRFEQKLDDRGIVYRTLVRLEQEDYLVFQFDIAYRTGNMSLRFSSELCLDRIPQNNYYIPTISKEILVRIDEILNYPNKLHHVKYVKEHLSSLDSVLVDMYLNSGQKQILNKIMNVVDVGEKI